MDIHPQKKKESEGVVIGWAGSLILHGSVLLTFVFYVYFWGFSIQGDVRVTSSRQTLPQEVRDLVEPDKKDRGLLGGTDRAMAEKVATHEGLKSVLTQAQERARQMPDEARMATLQANTAALERIKPTDVEDMLNHIETSMGVAPAATQPGEREHQPFDLDSSHISDVFPAVGPRKESGYLFERTDDHGEKMSYFVPIANMSKDDLKLADLYEMARKYPNLKRMLKTTNKLAEKMIKSEQTTQPAGK